MLKFLFIIALTLKAIQLKEIDQRIVSIDEQGMCRMKSSCIECLSFSHCAWCNSTDIDNKPPCFSPTLTADYCESDTVTNIDHGLSFLSNAQCTCTGGDMEHNCRPPQSPDGVSECSGRGECVCGRCVCEATPDPQHPTKTIVGEFCEYDNFSCNGPNCNEGPFYFGPHTTENNESEI